MKSISISLVKVYTVFYIRFRRFIFSAFLPFRSSYTFIRNTHSFKFPFLNRPDFISIPLYPLSNYSCNYFDILGSGWSSYSLLKSHKFSSTFSRFLWYFFSFFSSKYKLFLYSNIPLDYQYINWSLDIVSGFSWSPYVPSVYLKWIVSHKSIDIKYPWELARLQHLPQIALSLSSDQLLPYPDSSDLYAVIRNQLLDFIVSNPKDFGVNWSCPMDVAIRSSNICLTLAILPKLYFDSDYVVFNIFLASLNDHFLFLCRNLEYSPSSNNHYLSNLCGLLFTSIHLPESKKTNNAILFSTLELHTEFERQFLDDGGNFEGSSGYHRLSLEMVLYAIAALTGLDNDRLTRVFSAFPVLSQFQSVYYFPIKYDFSIFLELRDLISNDQLPISNSFIRKLRLSSLFLQSITLPNGLFPLIGDFDSGRFFKLDPSYLDPSSIFRTSDTLSFSDNTSTSELSCSSLDTLAAASALGLVDHPVYMDVDYSNFNSFRVISMLSKKRLLNSRIVNDISLLNSSPEHSVTCSNTYINSFPKVFNISFSYNIPDPDSIIFLSYPFFGLYIWRSVRFFLSIRCMTTIQASNITHFHDDQLSLNLIINGISHTLDPGSPTYGRCSYSRNLYRSSCAHLPFPLLPFNKDLPPFKPLNLYPASILSVNRSLFSAFHNTNLYSHTLSVKFSGSTLSITRTMNASESAIHFDSNSLSNIPFSPGYGVLVK